MDGNVAILVSDEKASFLQFARFLCASKRRRICLRMFKAVFWSNLASAGANIDSNSGAMWAKMKENCPICP